MSIIPSSRHKDEESPTLQAEAPAFHVEALLGILENTDRALSPFTERGMDGRTATILKEIEKSGAILLRTENGDIFIDVIDRQKALSVVDRLIKEFAT